MVRLVPKHGLVQKGLNLDSGEWLRGSFDNAFHLHDASNSHKRKSWTCDLKVSSSVL